MKKDFFIILFFVAALLWPVFGADNQKVDGRFEAIKELWEKDDTVIIGCVYKQEPMSPEADFPFARVLTYITVVDGLKGQLEVGSRLRLTSVVEDGAISDVNSEAPSINRDGNLVYVFLESSNLIKKGNFYDCEIGAFWLFDRDDKDFMSRFEKIKNGTLLK